MNPFTVDNTGPIGGYNIKSSTASSIPKQMETKPVGNEFLEVINKQLEMIEVRDRRIAELTNLLFRQTSILDSVAPLSTDEPIEMQNQVGNARWNRTKAMLERHYAKDPPKPEESIEDAAAYSKEADKAEQELNELS